MKPTPQREHFRHFLRMSVRWGDVDMLGHVNNAKFFTYDESVRMSYFAPLRSLDASYFDAQGPILAHIACDFLAQLHYPAELEIGLRVTRMGRSSLHTESLMFDGERPVAAVRGVIVWFDYRAQTSLSVPEAVRGWIRAREALAPEE